jgi:hypothetical protein
MNVIVQRRVARIADRMYNRVPGREDLTTSSFHHVTK